MRHLKVNRFIKHAVCLCFFIFTPVIYASFIEATIGTAVVNDATATYYNPAALTLVKNTQIIGLGSIASFDSEFSGESTQRASGFTQSGSTKTTTDYYLPSLYFALPSSDKLTVGLAIVSNFFNNNLEENSILRYAQSNNKVDNIDVVPALGFRLSPSISLGIGANFSYAHFITKPTLGFPSLNIPDRESLNDTSGNSVGGDAGILFQPSASTLIGVNYRTLMTYKLTGTSTVEGNPDFTSNDYFYHFWIPARTVLTISHFINPNIGFISTIQYIQWDIFNEILVRNIAAKLGQNNVIIDGSIPYHFSNAWLFTLGSQYWINTKCIIRAAASYIQSPGNSNYQISNGDSIVIGASAGYQISKNIILDASYAHAFMQDEDIHVTSGRNTITGVNSGSRDAFSLRATINLG